MAVDDFGIKHFSPADLEHLLSSLKKYFTIKVDRTGNNYRGLKIDWNYAQQHVDISMPRYIDKALHKFQRPTPKKPQYALHTWTPPIYGQQIQHTLSPDNLPVLNKKGTKRVQSVTVTFQYYTRTIDTTTIVAVNELAAEQSAPTDKTNKKYNMLLDYAHTLPDAKPRYHASDMCLHMDLDTAYLVQPKVYSRIGGHFCLSNRLHHNKKNI